MKKKLPNINNVDKQTNKKKFNFEFFLKNLPTSPGVYRFIGSDNEVLYIGKAKNLKRRVISYFSKNYHSPRIDQMIKQIESAEITPTRSESEALLLENNLIKSISPKYNILFRDDKSYPFLRVSRHKFPRISYYRGAIDDKADYFGPFPNAWAVRESIQILQKVFLIRNCSDSVFSNRSRPCLLFQIKRCSGPCVNKISEENYSKESKKAIDFLAGKHKKILNELQISMHREAENFNYEKAAVYRDQISTLSNILEQHSMEVSSKFDCDVIVIASDNLRLVVNFAMVRGGRHLGDRTFFLFSEILIGLNDSDVLGDALFNFIVEHYKNSLVPNKIVINQKTTIFMVHEWLSKNTEKCWDELKKSKFIYSPKNPYKDWLKMAEENAYSALKRRRLESETLLEKTNELLKFFQLSIKKGKSNFRIECFDVSHLSGESTYCSCVVYENFNVQPSQYRRFLIKDVKAGDDYAALKQALERRFKEKNNLPDIVLIDGGKGQLSVLKKVFNKFKINSVLLAGIVKGVGRKVGLERLIMSDGKILTFEKNQTVLMTLARIRDEAHRFAITGMRANRKKTVIRSVLDEIEGIGPQKRKALLSRFGGLHGLKRASEAELITVKGISEGLSKKIFSYFN